MTGLGACWGPTGPGAAIWVGTLPEFAPGSGVSEPAHTSTVGAEFRVLS